MFFDNVIKKYCDDDLDSILFDFLKKGLEVDGEEITYFFKILYDNVYNKKDYYA